VGRKRGEDTGWGGKQQTNGSASRLKAMAAPDPSVCPARLAVRVRAEARRSLLQPGFMRSAIYWLWGLQRCQKYGRIILKPCFLK